VAGQLAAIGIVTADIGKSTRFYRTLGLEIPEPPAAEDHFDFELPSGVRLMWDAEALIAQLDPEWERPAKGHAMALAFECKDAADVDATYRRVLDAGFRGKTEPYDAFWGQRYATVVDPDGNGVDLFASL
jgi:uncharacterized glyoxalase superfamily protein PhnB